MRGRMKKLQVPADEGRTRLYVLELGRFIAAFAVFIGHLALLTNNHAADPGQKIFGGVEFPAALGVQYFFVLSGFVMLHAHHGDFGKINAVPRFWWRRMCRIYPVYWLALAIPVDLVPFGPSPGAIVHIVTLDPGLLGPQYVQEYILPAWSLRYEIAFYLMFGLCLLPYVGKPLLACWVFLCIWRWSGPLIALFHPPFMMALYHLALTYGLKFIDFFEYYFFAGMAAAAVYLRRLLSRRVSMFLLAVSAILLILLLPSEAWGLTYGKPLFSLELAFAVAGIILGLAELERHGAIRLGRYAKWAGAISYPLYIFHGSIIMLSETRFPWGTDHLLGLYIHFAIVAAITLMISALVAFLFDMPVQRALRRLSSRAVSQFRPA